MRTVSTNAMIKSLDGMLGTKDLSQWESNFVSSIVDRTYRGQDAQAIGNLTDKQVERLTDIYRKHFS